MRTDVNIFFVGSKQSLPDHGVPGGGRAVHAAPEGEDADGGYGHLLPVPGSAANRLIGEVVQSRRRPLLRPSPG